MRLIVTWIHFNKNCCKWGYPFIAAVFMLREMYCADTITGVGMDRLKKRYHLNKKKLEKRGNGIN